MKNREAGAIAAALTLLAIIAIGLAWAGLREVACPAMEAVDPHATGPCVEFWLNRYQSLASGVFTLLGVAVAWYAVSSQISHAEKLATRDGKHSAKALIKNLRGLSARLGIVLSSAETKEHYGSNVIARGSIRVAEDALRNIEAMQSRLFSDDLANAVAAYNSIKRHKERLEAALTPSEEYLALVSPETIRGDMVTRCRQLRGRLTNTIRNMENNAAQRDLQ